MSIEKFLNEINRETATESAELVMTGIATAGVVIDIISRAVSWYKEYKENKQNKGKNEDEANFKISKEKFLDTHSKVATIRSIKNDIRKIVEEANNDITISRILKKSVEKKVDRIDIRSPKVNYKIHYSDNSDHIKIIDANHDISSALHWFILDTVKVLKSKYEDAIKFGLVKITTGDEDEGCIYVE